MFDLTPKTVSEFVEWDDKVVGLGKRLRTTSAPRWIVQTRVEGKSRKRVLGDADAISLIDARLAAIKLLERIKANQPEEVADAPNPLATVEEFAERFLADCHSRWKPGTAKANRTTFDKRIIPVLGKLRVRDVTKADIIRWMDAWTGAPGTQNISLALVSGMMVHAEIIGIRPAGQNPCKGLRKREIGFKAHYLSQTEFKRLNKVLTAQEADYPVEVAFIRFLALTGCRKGEARGLRWEWLLGQAARLPDSKTGPRSVWIGVAAQKVINELPRTWPLVFSRDGSVLAEHNIQKLWDVVRQKSKLKGVRIHDLRHSFASIAVGRGESLRTVAGLLGHSEVQTTLGYAHLAEAPVKEATERVSSYIASQIKPHRPNARLRGAEKAIGKPSLPIPPAIKDFQRSGKTIKKYCEKHGLDPDMFLRDIKAWRRRGGKS